MKKIIFLTLLWTNICCAQTIVMRSLVNNQIIGSLKIVQSPYGLLITPSLTKLSNGAHGFHIHAYPSCGNKGLQARGHFDPEHRNSHLGPYKNGHLGDLPVIYVTANKAFLPILAPRLTLANVKNRAVIIHEGSDNYTNNPKLGGGGKRIACGIIK